MSIRLILAALAAFAVTSGALRLIRREDQPRPIRTAAHPLSFNGGPGLPASARFPAEGDCPGRDPEGLARPAGWRRLFCVEGKESLLLCYAAPESPEAALKTLAGRFEAAGWKADSSQGLPGPVYLREGLRCLLSAAPDPEGAQVSVVQTTLDPRRGIVSKE